MELADKAGVKAIIAHALLMGRGAYLSPEDWAEGILKRLAYEGFAVVKIGAGNSTDE